MLEHKLDFTVTYENHTFIFDNGTKAYIFHWAIILEIDKRYGIEALEKFIAFVLKYHKEADETWDFGSLCIYISDCWDNLNDQDINALTKNDWKKLLDEQEI